MKDNNLPGYYAVIPANVRYDKRLPYGAILLYAEITALCNKQGYCWASNSYFAELYGVRNTTISNWIQKLIATGYLKTEHFPEKGNLRHIYLNDMVNQESFDFGEKTTIQKNDIVSIESEELSMKTEELSIKSEDLSIKTEAMNTTINTTINNKSSSRNGSDKPQDFQKRIEQSFRHWFNKIDPHPIADVDAILKKIYEHSDSVPAETLNEILNRAFERVVQEKQKKDWLTREVLIRIKWGVEDHFKALERLEANRKKLATAQLSKQKNATTLWTPGMLTGQTKNKYVEDEPETVTKKIKLREVDKDSLDYKRKKAAFDKELREGTNNGTM